MGCVITTLRVRRLIGGGWGSEGMLMLARPRRRIVAHRPGGGGSLTTD